MRQAADTDLPAILALYQQVDGEPSIDIERALVLFDRMTLYPCYRIYLAMLGKQIRGTFSILIMDNLAHAARPVGIVENVVVDQRWRGQGIGREMMAFARQYCRKAGCYKMMLSSDQSRIHAHRFYQALGFARHGYSFAVEFD